MKHIVCYSGGHSSALVAVEVVERFGRDNVILLNHDISSQVEHADIKRFKREVADHLHLDITYANADNFEAMTPLKTIEKLEVLQYHAGKVLCTYHLKTLPFYKWLEEHHPRGANDCVIYYGFDDTEENRIFRRTTNMRAMGYETDYPLAYWHRTITAIEEIGIQRPATYKIYRHANCQGCLKAGRQHWYATYCLRRDLFDEAKRVESKVSA